MQGDDSGYAVNRRILVVDDRQDIHDSFAALLSSAPVRAELQDLDRLFFAQESAPPAPVGPQHYELTHAYQGQEALARVQAAVAARAPYAMAFVDMRMPPGWDGLETIVRLWQADPLLEIVVCTAYADCDWNAVARTDSSGRLLVLRKPFEAIEVRQLASSLTQKWGHARSAARRGDELQALVEARTAALATSNERLRRHIEAQERQIRLIRELMSPAEELIDVGRFALAGRTITVDSCGGDFWTFWPLAPERLLLLIADVTGHGIAAAAVAAVGRGAADAALRRASDLGPGQLLGEMDAAVRAFARGRFTMTCAAVLLDAAAHRITTASAGHELPVLLRGAAPRQLHLLGRPGNPLGSETPQHDEVVCELDPGDRLVLYTDGVYDHLGAQAGANGPLQLRRALTRAPVEMSPTALRDALAPGDGAGTLPDDLSVVVCEHRPGGGDRDRPSTGPGGSECREP
jgi:serine phosphatase RsbU (regulator of sigma subunit)